MAVRIPAFRLIPSRPCATRCGRQTRRRRSWCTRMRDTRLMPIIVRAITQNRRKMAGRECWRGSASTAGRKRNTKSPVAAAPAGQSSPTTPDANSAPPAPCSPAPRGFQASRGFSGRSPGLPTDVPPGCAGRLFSAALQSTPRSAR